MAQGTAPRAGGLVITRKCEEAVELIDNSTINTPVVLARITVIETRGGQVRLLIAADPSLDINRLECLHCCGQPMIRFPAPLSEDKSLLVFGCANCKQIFVALWCELVDKKKYPLDVHYGAFLRLWGVNPSEANRQTIKETIASHRDQCAVKAWEFVQRHLPQEVSNKL